MLGVYLDDKITLGFHVDTTVLL